MLAGIAAKAADESGVSWAAPLGSYPAVWVLAVALLGRFAATWVAAVVRSAVFFAAMSVAYYAWAAEVHLLTAWLFLSVTAVPATALAVWWAGVLPGALLGGPGGDHPGRRRGHPRHGRTRLWALVLSVPLTWGLWLSGLLDQVP